MSRKNTPGDKAKHSRAQARAQRVRAIKAREHVIHKGQFSVPVTSSDWDFYRRRFGKAAVIALKAAIVHHQQGSGQAGPVFFIDDPVSAPLPLQQYVSMLAVGKLSKGDIAVEFYRHNTCRCWGCCPPKNLPKRAKQKRVWKKDQDQ